MAFRVGLSRLCDEARVGAKTKEYVGTGLKIFTATVNLAAQPSTLQSLTSVAMPGILVDDILIGFDFRPGTSTDVSYSVRVISNGNVQIVAHHDAATTTDPASATLTIIALRI